VQDHAAGGCFNCEEEVDVLAEFLHILIESTLDPKIAKMGIINESSSSKNN
jgi:hypothetical protein